MSQSIQKLTDFRFGRHLMQAKHYREFRDRAFFEWNRASCVKNLD